MKHNCLTCERSYYDEDCKLICRKKKTEVDEGDKCSSYHEEPEPCTE